MPNAKTPKEVLLNLARTYINKGLYEEARVVLNLTREDYGDDQEVMKLLKELDTLAEN